jgi:hypothetical protein
MDFKPAKRLLVALALACVAFLGARGWLLSQSAATEDKPATPIPAASLDGSPTFQAQLVGPIQILVDDYVPQPYQGDAEYRHNRLGGERGVLGGSDLDWGQGQVTATLSSGQSWGGLWQSLNHPIADGQSINFSAVLPAQILPVYQSQITGLSVQVAGGTSGRIFRLELKDGDNLRWSTETALSGGWQTLSYDLASLGDITQLVWVLDQATPGDYVVVDHLSLTATTQITEPAEAAFVWSYGMLLNNWNSSTGLVRDKARDATGEFDAIQSTGSLAAATAIAHQLGVIDRTSAVQIVNQISTTLLTAVPRYHGLWPHWVQKISPSGAFTIAHNTEWSSIDTAIAAISLLDAQSALGLDTSGTEQILQEIDWENLLTLDGISHGFSYGGGPLPNAWDTFGGESWLVALAYAASTHQVPPIRYSTPPTANGSGFIDELPWLFVLPPSVPDNWGTDWAAYREAAANAQVAYYPANAPASCFDHLGWFGLSAAEVPAPSAVAPADIYQAFGVGGRFSPSHDGSSLLGAPVVVPHYSAMIASLRPGETISMWNWLITQGLVSPLNNVESLMFSPGATGCDATQLEWNHLKGSWNLALQTLGWGRYLARQHGGMPILWQATMVNPLLRTGYLLLVPHGLWDGYLPMILKG